MKTSTKFYLIIVLLFGFSVAQAQVPPIAPPDLEYDAANVLSYFSEKYGEFAELSTPNWGQTSAWDYTATGDELAGLIVIHNLQWLPIQNATSAETKKYQYFHVDVFCNEPTDLRVGFHSNWPVNSNECYFPGIKAANMVPGKWYSIDYPISDLKYDSKDSLTSSWTVEGGYANANLLRFGNATDIYTYSNEIYVTNLIFFNGEPTCLGGVIRGDESGISNINDYSFNVFMSNNELNCSATEIISKITIYDVAGHAKRIIEGENLAVSSDVSSYAPGVYIVSAEFKNGETITKRFLK